MSSLIIETSVDPVAGPKVYGCPIKSYAVDGATDCGLTEAIAFGALRQSSAIEELTVAVSKIVRLRQQKTREIGDCVATVAEAIGSMDQKETNPDARFSTIDAAKLKRANEILRKYGVHEMELNENGQVCYSVAYKQQTDVQLVLDTENNDLQQNMNNLKNLMTKRDNAYAVASKVVDKINSTARDAIRAVGR